MNKQVRVSIRFPAESLKIVEREIYQTLGINIGEYLKMLIINKADNILDRVSRKSNFEEASTNTKDPMIASKELDEKIKKLSMAQTPEEYEVSSKEISDFLDSL